jgi:flagellar motor component MotA
MYRERIAMKKKRALMIGWIMVIIGVLLSFLIVLRGTLFQGQPVDPTNLIMTIITNSVLITGFGTTTHIIMNGKDSPDKK